MGRWLSGSAAVSTLRFAPRWNRSALAVGERGVVDIAWRLITSSTPRIVQVRLLSAMQSSGQGPVCAIAGAEGRRAGSEVVALCVVSGIGLCAFVFVGASDAAIAVWSLGAWRVHRECI